MSDEEFRAFFEAHYPAVLAFGLRRVDPDTARDVAAETFLVAWRRLEGAPDQPRSWLLAVARKVLANELRRVGRNDRLALRVGQHEASAAADLAEQADPAALVTREAVVLAALATLSPADRELLRLIGWELLDQRDAARVLGCSTTALKVRLHRARRRLREALAGVPEAPRPTPGPTRSATAPTSELETR